MDEIHIITDSKNQLHMVWEQFHRVVFPNGSSYEKNGVLYSKYNGINTSVPESIKAVTYHTRMARHFLTLNPRSDLVYLAWDNGSTYYTSQLPTGEWGPAIPVEIPSIPFSTFSEGDLQLRAFHITSQGILYFFFISVTETNQLLVIKYEDDQFIAYSLDLGHPIQQLDVELDSSDTFYLAYFQSDDTGNLQLVYQTFYQGFSSPIVISNLPGDDLDLALDTEDVPHLAWTQKRGYREIFYTHQTNTKWLELEQATNVSQLGDTLYALTKTVPEVPILLWSMLIPQLPILFILSKQTKKKIFNRRNFRTIHSSE